MAKRASHGTKTWLDEFDVTGFINMADQKLDQEAPPSTTLGDTGPRVVTGNYGYVLSQTGFFDAAVGGLGASSFDLALWNRLVGGSGADIYLARLFGGSDEGSLAAYDAVVHLTEQPRSAQIGGVILLNLTSAGANGLVRGVVLRNATISGNGNGTGRNLGATTAGQTFRVVYRVFSGTFTSFDISIQESQNDGAPDAYGAIAALNQSISAVGTYPKTTTGATEAWKRVTIANWIGTSAVVGVIAGVVAGT